MTAYYNENAPYAAQWLRNLIKQGLIAPGDVDARSIVDVPATQLAGYDQCHFFAGIGGWSAALRLAGWPDDRAVWTGSCPCQPFSLAGKRKGFDDERHLWPVWRELIRERRPAIVFGEQVARAPDWVRLVRGDLEAMAYAVGILPIEAASAGADHMRDRIWFVADSSGDRQHVEQGNPGVEEGARVRRDQPSNGGLVDDPRQRWREGRSEHELHFGRHAVADAGSMGDASGKGLQVPEPEVILGARR